MQSLTPRSLIPWIFVAGMLVVVAVNAGMVVVALSSFSGLAHRDAFGRGIAYNRVLEAVERQEQLGWTWRLALEAGADGGEVMRVSMADAAGRPLTGARIAALVQRPVERLPPIAVDLQETGIGSYAAAIRLPQRGQWDVSLSVERAGERFVAIRRIFAR